MQRDQLTRNSQHALQAARQLALDRGHAEIDAEHLFIALLQQPDGLVPNLLENFLSNRSTSISSLSRFSKHDRKSLARDMTMFICLHAWINFSLSPSTRRKPLKMTISALNICCSAWPALKKARSWTNSATVIS